MSGGYSSSTRVGNWSEDKQARERQIAELLAKRAAGTLASDVHAARVAAGQQPVALPPRGDDGVLRFSDVAVLCSATGGALAACVHDTIAGPPDAPPSAQAALTPAQAPVARAAVQLESVAVRSVDDEAAALMRTGAPDMVHYGQKVRLRLHDGALSAASPPLSPHSRLWLSSQPVSLSAAARHSKHGLVSWSAAEGSADSVWLVLTPDPEMQLASEGQPVLLGAPLLLRHVMTQQCLAAEAAAVGTDWGAEREVSVHTFAPAGHVASLQAAAASKPEAALLKAAAEANVWRFA